MKSFLEALQYIFLLAVRDLCKQEKYNLATILLVKFIRGKIARTPPLVTYCSSYKWPNDYANHKVLMKSNCKSS